MRYDGGMSAVMLAVAMLLGAGLRAADAIPPCAFDTTGDPSPELVVPDADDDGFCDFPDRKTRLPGTLRFTADTPVRFTSNAIVSADTIVVEAGAELVGEAATLRSLSLIALTGNLDVGGTVDVTVGDDIDLVAKHGSVHVTGDVHLDAVENVIVEAGDGDAVVTPSAAPVPGTFALRGGMIVSIKAKRTTGSGDVRIEDVHVAGRRIEIDGRAQRNNAGTLDVTIAGDVILTTDPAATGFGGNGDVRIAAGGRVRIEHGAVLDSARNVKVQTRAPGQHLCLAGGVVLEAVAESGAPRVLLLSAVRGTVFDDGTTTFTGTLAVRDLVTGPCPP
jgi:hypothetical protein